MVSQKTNVPSAGIIIIEEEKKSLDLLQIVVFCSFFVSQVSYVNVLFCRVSGSLWFSGGVSCGGLLRDGAGAERRSGLLL